MVNDASRLESVGVLSHASIMPTGYDVPWSPELEAKILALIAEGKTWSEIKELTNVTVYSIYKHRDKDNDFEALYIRAREAGAEAKADLLEKAHENISDPIKARLFSENTRWLLARRHSATYGDRLDITANQTVQVGAALDMARKRAGIEHKSERVIEAAARTVSETVIDAVIRKGVENSAVSTDEADSELNHATITKGETKDEGRGSFDNLLKPEAIEDLL